MHSGPIDQASGLAGADREILRRLGAELAAIAALGVHREKAELWRRVNDRETLRPTVLIFQVPWHEMNVDDELTCRCADEWARAWETELRRTLYQWRHFPGDMIVPDYLSCPLVIHDSGYGLVEDVDIVRTDAASDVVSRHFHLQIVAPEDVGKIQTEPTIIYDAAATEANYQRMLAVFGDIMPVRKQGVSHIWYTPWDNLIRWWGVTEAMMDLIQRPEMVHEAVDRMAANCLSRLEQYQRLNLLSNAPTATVGSGGYGLTRELPGVDYDPGRVQPHNLWGCSNAQIFSEVSPQMHWDFAIRHDLPWLERWGLNYYGCCEPLDLKVEIMRRIPRLRKVSMSPWIKPERAAAAVGDDLVFSYKPNPAILAEKQWRPEQARLNLQAVLEAARDCHVEVILKDISTVGHDPRRLWEWETLAMELVRQYE